MSPRKTIKQLRPKLRSVAPLTFWVCVGFALFNVAIWFLLDHVPVTAIKQNPVPVVGEVFFTYKHWGLWFLSLSVGIGSNLFRNDWKWIKRFLLLGLLSKLIWAYALLYMIINGIPAFATFILWAFLAWVQAWTIIFFTPSVHTARDTLPENERFKNVN